MHPTSFLPIFAASVTAASTLLANNLCGNTVWITLAYQNGTTVGPTQLPSGLTFSQTIVGQGNSFGVTRDASYWSSSTPKFILGTSTSDGTLYWSVNDVDGDPFAADGFKISSASGNQGNVCGSATTYDGEVHACPDENVTLTVSLCTE